jgi:hypothetical protein
MHAGGPVQLKRAGCYQNTRPWQDDMVSSFVHTLLQDLSVCLSAGCCHMAAKTTNEWQDTKRPHEPLDTQRTHSKLRSLNTFFVCRLPQFYKQTGLMSPSTGQMNVLPPQILIDRGLQRWGMQQQIM